MTENEVTLDTLSVALARIPTSYGEGQALRSEQARYIASQLLKTYFMVDLTLVPDIVINETMLTAKPHLAYELPTTLSPNEEEEYLHHNIAAAISDFITVKQLKKMDAERAIQREKDEQLAFTLMKAASPTNLGFVHWKNVPRTIQTQWLAVAEKARQELS